MSGTPLELMTRFYLYPFFRDIYYFDVVLVDRPLSIETTGFPFRRLLQIAGATMEVL
jgi:hypothetical protein